MINKDLSKVQLILNNATHKQDFTINLSTTKSRYVVIDGEYFVDANLHLEKLEWATHTAIKNKQISIYDLVDKKLIFVNN